MPQKKRDRVITANWKMYKTIEEAEQFVTTLSPLIEGSQVKVYIAVPFTAIGPTAKLVKEKDYPLQIGAQNMNDASEGAFTGEVAGKMLKEVGASFVILGHSERRHIFHEESAFINRKIKRAFLDDLQPVLCIGESCDERTAGRTQDVLEKQLLESLDGLNNEEMAKLILAYEPVWAIGTGKVAHPDDAQAAHLFCRQLIAREWGKKVANGLIIQYGGSVKPENTADLMKQEDVDGLLVGGASLSPHSFSQIIKYAYSEIES